MTNPKDLVGAKKAPLDLVPVAGAIMAAPAHQNGADKYGAFNWRLQPVQLMTYIAATKRHLDAFIDGQDLAPDTGLHHISHIIANLNIIADAMGLGNLIDNRPPKGPAADMLRKQDKTAIAMQPGPGDILLGRFLCGHWYGDEPIQSCGTGIHSSRTDGILKQ